MRWSRGCLVLCCLLLAIPRATDGHCQDKNSAEEYKVCIGADESDGAWFSSMESWDSDLEWSIIQAWLGGQWGVAPPGSYRTRVTIEWPADPFTPPSGYTSSTSSNYGLNDPLLQTNLYTAYLPGTADLFGGGGGTYLKNTGPAVNDLLKEKYPTSEMGRGELLYWMSSFAPKDTTVRVVGDNDKVANKLMQFPDAWINWGRCAGPVTAVEAYFWRKDVGPFCPDNVKKVFVQSTVDILSRSGDSACLDTLTDRWGRQGDDICLTDGRKVRTVPIRIEDPENPGTYVVLDDPPPFAARRLWYKEWRELYIPFSIDRSVQSGRYSEGLLTYEQVDAGAVFPGVNEPWHSPRVTLPCPPGTWMTCKEAPANSEPAYGICNYPAATHGETVKQWHIDINLFNTEKKQSNTVVKLLSFPSAGPFEDTVPGVNGATCYPCITAGGRTHYGNYLGKPSSQNLVENVLDYYCPGEFKSPVSCTNFKVTPFDPKTGITTLATCVCGNGYWRDSSGNCQPCPAGSYCNVLNATGDSAAQDPRPIPCPDGFFSGVMAKECTECSTDVNQCTSNQRLTSCRLNTDTTKPLSERTKYQKADAKCVSCNDCEAFGRQGGKPCRGYTPLVSKT